MQAWAASKYQASAATFLILLRIESTSLALEQPSPARSLSASSPARVWCSPAAGFLPNGGVVGKLAQISDLQVIAVREGRPMPRDSAASSHVMGG
jgi:hypothetical protein